MHFHFERLVPKTGLSGYDLTFFEQLVPKTGLFGHGHCFLMPLVPQRAYFRHGYVLSFHRNQHFNENSDRKDNTLL